MKEGSGGSVRFEHVTKTYGAVTAVADLSLKVESGEFLTLLGPSGCGKTTTLLMIAGFEHPTSGQIYIDETPAAYMPANKRGLGMVFQNYALFPHMTVFENIAYSLQVRRKSTQEIKDKVTHVLDLVGLSHYENRFPRQLSGGQQQRVAVARALVFDPRVLLFDEPLGALDRKLREKMQIELRRIHEKMNTTMIYVTHDQEEALVLSDRIAVMNQGSLVQLGAPGQLYREPANRFIANFIGESNVISGRVHDIDGSTCRVVTAAGLEIHVSNPENVSAGQEIELALRPEKVVFVTNGTQWANLFEGKVETVVYVGDVSRFEVRVREHLFLLKQQNRSGMPQFQVGDCVRIGWQLQDSTLLRK